MRHIFSKTFGGLDSYYYFRHFFFGSLFASFMIVVMFATKNTNPIQVFETKAILITILNTALYPYARLVYETIFDFILGDNEIWSGMLVVLTLKVFWISILWMLAVLFAPIGLIYLYFVNSKKVKVSC